MKPCRLVSSFPQTMILRWCWTHDESCNYRCLQMAKEACMDVSFKACRPLQRYKATPTKAYPLPRCAATTTDDDLIIPSPNQDNGGTLKGTVTHCKCKAETLLGNRIAWGSLVVVAIWRACILVQYSQKETPGLFSWELFATNWPIEKALHAIGYNQIPTK